MKKPEILTLIDDTWYCLRGKKGNEKYTIHSKLIRNNLKIGDKTNELNSRNKTGI